MIEMEGRSRAYDSEPSLGADTAAKRMSSKEFTCSLLNYKTKVNPKLFSLLSRSSLGSLYTWFSIISITLLLKDTRYLVDWAGWGTEKLGLRAGIPRDWPRHSKEPRYKHHRGVMGPESRAMNIRKGAIAETEKSQWNRVPKLRLVAQEQVKSLSPTYWEGNSQVLEIL